MREFVNDIWSSDRGRSVAFIPMAHGIKTEVLVSALGTLALNVAPLVQVDANANLPHARSS